MRKPKALSFSVAAAAFALVKALPLDTASALSAFLTRLIGRFQPVQKVAERSLARTMPELPSDEIERVVAASWDNLGRIAAELAHLSDLKLLARIDVVGREKLDGLVPPYLFVTGHLGNWEVLPGVLKRLGHPIDLLYRPANDPAIDRAMAKARLADAGRLVPKGPSAARQLYKAAKAGRSIGMLIDQKENRGVPLDFFGRPAMTSLAAPRLAYDCRMPVVPGRVVREGKRLRVELDDPLTLDYLAERDGETRRLMVELHRRLEGWIREYPGQWLWQHRRWPEQEKGSAE